MNWDFANIAEILSKGISPEITHFQKNSHPGQNWWLKTVVPPEHKLIELWNRIHAQHPHQVKIEPGAWDWYQNPIPNCLTIWLDHSIDIRIKKIRSRLDFVILPFEEGFNLLGKELFDSLNKTKTLDQTIDPSWQSLLDVTQLMSSWTTDQQARARRQIFKVVNNEQNRRSSHKRSKLDPL